MKTRLLAFVFAIGLMLTPALASASPMDGTYLGAGAINAGFFSITLDPYTAVIGADPDDFGVDYTGAYLPSADVLATGPYGDLGTDGFTVYLVPPTDPADTPSVIAFEGNTDEFTGSGTLSFFDLDPVLGFMTAVLNASGFSSLFGDAAITVTGILGREASTPVPAAIWLLGSGLIGLVGIRKQFRKA